MICQHEAVYVFAGKCSFLLLTKCSFLQSAVNLRVQRNSPCRLDRRRILALTLSSRARQLEKEPKISQGLLGKDEVRSIERVFEMP
jgi:hypothetical protein